MFYDTNLAVYIVLCKKNINLLFFYFCNKIIFANFESPLKTLKSNQV